jgi:hypothetical protein
VDEPKLHLYETGIIRITRHPQMVGSRAWAALRSAPPLPPPLPSPSPCAQCHWHWPPAAPCAAPHQPGSPPCHQGGNGEGFAAALPCVSPGYASPLPTPPPRGGGKGAAGPGAASQRSYRGGAGGAAHLVPWPHAVDGQQLRADNQRWPHAAPPLWLLAWRQAPQGQVRRGRGEAGSRRARPPAAPAPVPVPGLCCAATGSASRRPVPGRAAAAVAGWLLAMAAIQGRLPLPASIEAQRLHVPLTAATYARVQAFEVVKARTSTLPFQAVWEGRQQLPADFYKEFLRVGGRGGREGQGGRGRGEEGARGPALPRSMLCVRPALPSSAMLVPSVRHCLPRPWPAPAAARPRRRSEEAELQGPGPGCALAVLTAPCLDPCPQPAEQAQQRGAPSAVSPCCPAPPWALMHRGTGGSEGQRCCRRRCPIWRSPPSRWAPTGRTPTCSRPATGSSGDALLGGLGGRAGGLG